MNEIESRNQSQQLVRYARPPAPQQASAQASGMTGRDVLRILRRRKWVIILPTLFFLGISIGGTALWLKYAPEYTAEAFVRIRPPQGGPLRPTRQEWSTDIIERHVMSAAAMVKSKFVLDAAARQVSELSWYKDDPDTAVERLFDATNVSPVPNTDLIKISVTLRQKAEVPDIATAVAQAFVTETINDIVEGRREEIGNLKAKIQDLDKQLTMVRNEQGRARRGAESIGSGRFRGMAELRVEMLGKQVLQLQLLLSEAQESLASIQKQIDEGHAESLPLVVQRIMMDPQMRSLMQSEMNLNIQLENALSKFGARHRSVQTIQNQIKAVRRQTAERHKALVQEQTGSVLAEADGRVRAIIAQLLNVDQEYEKAKLIVNKIEVRRTALVRLETQEEDILASQNRINKELVNMTLASRVDRPISLRRRAEAPTEPSAPRWGVTVPAGSFLGLMIGLGLAFVLEFADTSIKSPADVAERINLPLLGIVPHSDDLEEEVDDMRMAVLDKSNSLITEAFRQIRTCLMFSAPAEQRRSLLITSALPEDGRTSVTLNLAGSIAESGKKVLVIDTNFRQPAVSKIFTEKDSSDGGLSNALVAQADWKEFVREVRPNLFVLPAGPLPPNPAELLGSDEMRQVLNDSVNQYDQVLLDGAPCLVVSDAAILSTITDGVLLVVRAGSNTHGIVMRAKETLSRLKARILGTVLNGVRITTGGYLRKNYETFYEYHQTPSELLPVGAAEAEDSESAEA